MHKNKLCEILRLLREEDIICYAYRETALSILMTNQTEGTVHLVTDVSSGVLTKALGQHGFSDVSVGDRCVDAKINSQNVRILLFEGEQENISKTISQPLTVYSLLFRDDGSVYDEFGGTDDIRKKLLRKTGIPIRDKNQFCTVCFNLTLRKGFAPDAAVRDEMKKMVTLPMSQKIQFIMSVRTYLKNQNFNMEYVLNALSYDGLFSNTGSICTDKSNELKALIRKADHTCILLLLCYLAGFKGEHLKSVPSMEIKKESYEKIFQFIKTTETADMSDIRKNFSELETKGVLFVMEFLALIAGKEFVVTEPKSRLFRTVDQSEFWKREETSPKKDLQPAVMEQKPVDHPEKQEQPVGNEPEDMFGGMEDEGYEAEEGDSWTGHIGDSAALNLRNASQNHFIRK